GLAGGAVEVGSVEPARHGGGRRGREGARVPVSLPGGMFVLVALTACLRADVPRLVARWHGRRWWRGRGGGGDRPRRRLRVRPALGVERVPAGRDGGGGDQQRRRDAGPGPGRAPPRARLGLLLRDDLAAAAHARVEYRRDAVEILNKLKILSRARQPLS